jgi:hypothetical protein
MKYAYPNENSAGKQREYYRTSIYLQSLEQARMLSNESTFCIYLQFCLWITNIAYTSPKLMPTTDENLVSYDEGKNHKDEGESQYRHV